MDMIGRIRRLRSRKNKSERVTTCSIVVTNSGCAASSLSCPRSQQCSLKETVGQDAALKKGVELVLD